MDISSPMRKAKELKLGLDQNLSEGKSRICSLPDSILHHILSFVDIKEAVRTSVLSKRWEFLWTSVSKLEFEEDLKQSDEKREEFMDFVERALLLHDSSTLHAFSLTCKVPSDGPTPRIKSFIYAALGHKVQKIVLNLDFNCCHGSFVLPRHLFVSESLNELKLDFSYDLKLPSFVSFLNLKILALSKVIFMDDNLVNQLFSSCPNLMKLDLIQCRWDNLKHVYISAPMLEHLKISESNDYENTQLRCCKFTISGPRLKVFHYLGELSNEYCISEASSLVDAHIDVYYGNGRTEREAADRAHKLFEGLATVKDLCVSSITLEVLTDAEELVPSLPLFHDLNHLHLEVGLDDESLCHTCEAALLRILHNSPHLESIYFEPRMHSDMFSAQLDPVPPCFLTHLKIIKVDWSLGCKEEVKELMAIIKSAKVLERIELGYNYGATMNGAILDVLRECIKSKVVFDCCSLKLLVDHLRPSINDGRGSFVLPRRLFDCESLNELELEFSCDLRLPSFVYFPNLKILRLSQVIFTDYNSVNQLFSGCPNLEKLELNECNWDNVKAVYVSAPKLEHLKIVEVDGYGCWPKRVKEPDFCQFMISGPRLKFFHCQGKFIYEYCISDAPSLVSALIGMYSLDGGAKRQAAYRAHKLLGVLSNVKDLHVSCLTLEVLTEAEELFPRLPVFHNLKQLEFSNDWIEPLAAGMGLLKILHNSPHLESIYFASRDGISMFSAVDGLELDPVLPCFLSHLKTIKFGKFCEYDEALNALKIILKSARALEKIDLGSSYENSNYNALLDLVKECMKSDIVIKQSL